MDDRLREEFDLLKQGYPNAIYQDRWVLLPEYPLPTGWSAARIDVAFYVKPPYPANSPYGIYAPVGLTFNGQTPANYKPAKESPRSKVRGPSSRGRPSSGSPARRPLAATT